MPLKLLLDEHIDPKLVQLLGQRGIEAVSMQEWRSGHYVGHPDHEILISMASEGLTLLSYDVHSMPELLDRLAEEEVTHGGIILVSERTIKQNALSALALALENLVNELGDVDWHNRMVFLRR